MPIIVLALALTSLYTNETWALPLLAALLTTFSLMFYRLAFSAMNGLVLMKMNPNVSIRSIWLSRISQYFAGYVMYVAGGEFAYVLAFLLPWMLINLFSDTLSTLIRLEILDVYDRD